MTRMVRLFCLLFLLTTTSFPSLAVTSFWTLRFRQASPTYRATMDSPRITFWWKARTASALLVASAIFIYMEPQFRSRYPDKGNAPSWPPGTPSSLTELAQSAPFRAMFALPFKTFVITAYAFTTMDDVDNFAVNPDAAALEEHEFYDLTRYLYMTYAGTGKTFILKHWEGDFIGLRGFDTTKDISPDMVDAMNIWLSARQRGISARDDSGNPSGVGVFHAVEALVCSITRVRV